MAEVIWTIPCLENLDEIADYIALDKPAAAKKLIRKIFSEVDKLSQFPESGNIPPELKGTVYRRIVVPPTIVYYRIKEDKMIMLHARRSERHFDLEEIQQHDQ